MKYALDQPLTTASGLRPLGTVLPTTLRCMANDLRLFPIHFLTDCFDCGAQRTYTLQPMMQKGPWERPQLCSALPIEIAFSSSARSGSIPERLTVFQIT